MSISPSTFNKEYRFRLGKEIEIPDSVLVDKLKSTDLPRGLDGREGQYSISINDQWRICFRFKDGDAYDVEITDSH